MASLSGTATQSQQDGLAIDKLITQAEELLKNYNPAVYTMDAYIRDTIGEVTEDDDDKAFVQQCFYGCLRYKKFLKIFLSSFYFNYSSKIQRSDYTRYMILCYVTVFRIEELGMRRFKAIMTSQDPTKMFHFLSYLYDMHNINVWLKDEWVKVLDRKFVEGTLIGTIEKRMSAVQSFLESNRERAFGKTSAVELGSAGGGKEDGPEQDDDEEGEEKQGTGSRRTLKKPVFQEFNLHPPRPRVAPEPMPIMKTAAHKPVPKHLNRTTLDDINRQREETLEAQRTQVLKKYEDPANAPFKLHETRSNIDKVRAEVEAERYKELNAGQFKARPVPKYPKQGATVKLNVASVLREDALYKKKQEQDAALIKEYEASLRDSTQFYVWQTDMKNRDDEQRRREVERRRLEMVASQQEAVEASERRRAENKIFAKAMKVESAALLEAAEAEAEEDLLSRKALVEEVKEVRTTAPREAEARIYAERVKAREELNAQLEAARIRAEEEARIEQERKDDLIRQIRALEHVPKQRVKVFDPTESSGVGLLEEMSLVELKERLELNKSRLEEERTSRRQNILKAKREKEVDLRNRVANVSRIRASASAANRDARARRKAAEKARKEQEAKERAAGNMKLAERLIAKRQARRKEEVALAEEAERIAKQRMFLGAAKAAIEERHFEQQMLGAEREAQDRQAGAQQAARAVEHTKAIERRARAVTKKIEERKDKELDDQRHRQMEGALARTYMQEMEEMREKKDKFRTERIRHEATLKARDTVNPYAATVTQKHLEQARTMTMRRSGVLQQSGKSVRAGSVKSTPRAASNEVQQWADFA